MPLPPRKHPAWLLVAVIASLGAALTSRMGGSPSRSTAFLGVAVVFIALAAKRIRKLRRSKGE